MKKPKFVIGRDEGYIGVLIDDLVTKGTNEPYRIFTSRAEYRLSLRQDNADLRLTKRGIIAGLVQDPLRIDNLFLREKLLSGSVSFLTNFQLPRLDWTQYGKAFNMSQRDGKQKSAFDVLSMPDINLEQIIEIIKDKGKLQSIDEYTTFTVPSLIFDTLEATCKYSQYLSRQEQEISRWKKNNIAIPNSIVYSREEFPSFSSEELEILQKNIPETIFAASQLPGIAPHTVIFLQHYVMKRKYTKNKQ